MINVLDGMTVVDLSQGIAGPYCAAMLCEFGAQVIKIEPPSGDWARRAGPRIGTTGVFFESFNRGKQSIALDLKNDADLAQARQIIQNADILVENSRPGSLAKLGLGAEVLMAEHPELIYVSVSGFGQSGPKARLPATDTVMQAYVGLSCVAGTKEKPERFRLAMVDIVAGLYASQATLAAVIKRLRTGSGQHLDISLTHAMAALQASKIADVHANGGRQGNQEALAIIGLYEAKDGIFAVSAAHGPQEVAALTALGCEELLNEARFATLEDRQKNQFELRERVAETVIGYSVQECTQRLEDAQVPCQRVLDYMQFMADPQVSAMQLFQAVGVGADLNIMAVRTPGIDASSARLIRAPMLNEHEAMIRGSQKA